MTLAEIVLIIAGGVGIYLLLRPLQRRLERYLARTVFARPRVHRTLIDVTEFTSHPSQEEEEDDEHRT